MDWFKCDVDYADDGKICQLAREWGSDAARAFWPMLLGFVYKHMLNKSGMVRIVTGDPLSPGEHSDIDLAKFVHSHPTVVRKRLDRCATVGLISRDQWENDRTIFIPKILDRLGVTKKGLIVVPGDPPKKASTDIREEREESEEEKEIKRIRAALQLAFETIWLRYPNKDGKKEAERHYLSTVSDESKIPRVETALDRYLGWLTVQNRERDWLRAKQGKTWFNNWSDWEADERDGYRWDREKKVWAGGSDAGRGRSAGHTAFTGEDFRGDSKYGHLFRPDDKPNA